MEFFLWAFAYLGAGILLAVITTHFKVWTDNMEETPSFLGLIVLMWPFLLVAIVGIGIVWLLGAVVQRLSATKGGD